MSIMATSSQGKKFRRVSSNKNHSRSASTGDILSNSPPSFPEATVYNALLHSGAKGRPKIHRNSSSSQGESFHHLQSEGETVQFSAYSIPGATSLDSVNPGEYECPLITRQISYPHHSRSHSRGTRGRDGASSSHRRNRYSLQLPPSEHSLGPPGHALLDSHSSRESFLSGRGLYTRQTHLRDSMSQDTMGERDFDSQFRYNLNNSTTLPTLSLQDSFHRDNLQGGRGISTENCNLRRNLQEFDVMPIHEAFSHRAMAAGPGVPVHLSPPPQNPTPKENGNRAGGIIDRQPVTVETQQNQSPQRDTQQDGRAQQQLSLPQTYYPVFFSPESGRLFMCVDGSYKPVPDTTSQYYGMNITDDGGLGVHRGPQLNQSDQRLSIVGSSGRQTSSSYGISAPYDYYYCSILMMVLYILCLNAVTVLFFSLPAIWFAKKAMKAKYEGDYARTLSLGTRALCLNIIGGCLHILFLCALTFIPILLRFVFSVI